MPRTLRFGERSVTLEETSTVHFQQHQLPWGQIQAEAYRHFDANPDSWSAHNAYFNCFTPIFRALLAVRRYDDAEELWRKALSPALKWEREHPGRFLHKGAPYYYWAMAALLKGDIDCGYILMHQALGEDSRTFQDNARNQPSYAFVSLDYARIDQAFRPWVEAQAQLLGGLLEDYTATHRRALTQRDVRTRFLADPRAAETVFLFTYTLARLVHLARLPEEIQRNPFAGQLHHKLLFDITLVIDSTIRVRAGTRYFRTSLDHLLTVAGPRLVKEQFSELNRQFIDDFDGTVQAAVDGALRLAEGVRLNRLQCDVALAYGIRNHAAHRTDTANTIYTRSSEVQSALFRPFFAAVDYL
jgi:hypothetical protein